VLQSQPVNQRHLVSYQVPVPQFQRVNPSQRPSLTRKAQAPQFQRVSPSQRANQFPVH